MVLPTYTHGPHEGCARAGPTEGSCGFSNLDTRVQASSKFSYHVESSGDRNAVCIPYPGDLGGFSVFSGSTPKTR